MVRRRSLQVVRVAAAFLAVMMCSLVVGAEVTAQLPEDRFAIAVIPDTQIYVQSAEGAQVFQEQYEWVIDQREARNFVFVSHVGDVAQNPGSQTEWDRIESVFEVLDNAGMPYGISPGNHDIEADGTAPEYDARFSTARYANKAWFGDNHDQEGNRSSFQYATVPGHQLLFIHVRHLQPEYGDVDSVLSWFAGVLDDHPDHLVFVTTHEFTRSNGTVSMPALQAEIQSSCNVVAVFSGHRFGEGRGSFSDRCGRTVHHVLTNYQDLDGGGQGFLRTVDIDRLTLEADFAVYSPTLDEFGLEPAESFSTSLAPLVPVDGDASCDRIIDLGDALVIAQYSVGVRSAATACPLGQPEAELNRASSDVDNDGQVDLGDALLVAQCTVGIPNVYCGD